MGEKRGLGGKNVIEMTPLKLPQKYKKIIKSEKKFFFTITYLFLDFRKKIIRKRSILTYIHSNLDTSQEIPIV